MAGVSFSVGGNSTNDASEPLDEQEKRPEAELSAERAERDKYKDQFQMVAHDLTVQVWEGFTQADLDTERVSEPNTA